MTNQSSQTLIRQTASDYGWKCYAPVPGVDEFRKDSRFVEVIYDRIGRVNSVRIGTPGDPKYHRPVSAHNRATVLDELERREAPGALRIVI